MGIKYLAHTYLSHISSFLVLLRSSALAVLQLHDVMRSSEPNPRISFSGVSCIRISVGFASSRRFSSQLASFSDSGSVCFSSLTSFFRRFLFHCFHSVSMTRVSPQTDDSDFIIYIYPNARCRVR
ncbi:hypothetical protein BJ138DRAFT_865369 [Hygrophoropsis aurantiaca]|uniref:Uncharacterized protein n=1 Tax=Hygrophoropsis aurantiaca TaxID=72124 RepID=A0ACB7ZV81_9AGAM|nr:hypothetical protein BJ138DRAFT_865369 [Hygrophoropsis aurantiaca]